MATACEIGQLLQATERNSMADVKQLILESLKNTKDAWIVHGLVDFYIQAQSKDALDILFQVSEPHDKQILDRLGELLKGSNRLQALMLCGHLVHKQVPWIHSIARHSIFPYIIKIIKEATDVPILMSAVLLITSVLPMIPVSVKDCLHDIFDGFFRLAKFNLIKPVSVPDVYLLHLQVGVYSLFHRLYGMYPCHFLTYLRTIYCKDENQQVFHETIMPMLERVRMHPLLVTASKDKEISPERWRRFDVHDIVVECAKLSLDLIEGTYEDTKCPVIGTAHQHVVTAKYPDVHELHMHPQITDQLNAAEQLVAPKPLGIEDPHNKPIVSLIETSPFFSPSQVCGLSTPPPGETSQPGTARNTPHTSVPESPLPVESEGREKKRLSGLSISLAGIIPGPVVGGSGNSVPPSPLKPEFTTEPPFSTYRMQAIRRIDFQQQQQQTKKSPVTRTSSQEGRGQGHLTPKATASEGSLEKSSESLRSRASLLRQATLGDNSPTLELEVSAIGAAKSKSRTAGDRRDGTTAKGVTSEDLISPKKSRSTEESKEGRLQAMHSAHSSTESNSDNVPLPVKAKSQLSKNLAMSDAAKPQTSPDSKSDAAKSASNTGQSETTTAKHISPKVDAKPGGTSGVSIPGKKAESEQSHSVPSIYELPHFIESLGGTTEEADDEVSALTGSQMTDSSLSSGMEPTDVNLTAESVQLFMKKVNRIRFNSMNIASREKAERLDKPKPLRANSCPDFEESMEEAFFRERHPSRERALTGLPDSPVRSKASEVDFVATRTVTSTVTMTTETTATIASQTSFPNFGVVDTGEEVKVCLEREDVDTMFPYTHMIPGALHVAPFMQCYSCVHASEPPGSAGGPVPSLGGCEVDARGAGSPTRFNAMALGIEKPYFSTLSPPEILDRHLTLGQESHRAHAAQQGKAEKGHWPLVAGLAWSEDVGILRGQILLLHNQLLYERHKRELYAKRNRRLLGRIVKTAALEERTAAMTDQIGLQEDLIGKLKSDLASKEARCKEMQQAKEQLEFHRDMTQRSCAQEIDTLKASQASLTADIQKAQAENQKLFKELQSTRAQLFDTEQELSVARGHSEFSLDLQAQIARLNKELLLMGELQQKYQQRLGAVSSGHNASEQNSFILDSYKNELERSKQGLQEMTVLYEATRARLGELEQTVKVKESNIVELKSGIEEMKRRHKCQTQALEDKYTTQRRVQQALQGRILDLTAQLQLKERPNRASASPGDCESMTSSAAGASEADHVTPVDQ